MNKDGLQQKEELTSSQELARRWLDVNTPRRVSDICPEYIRLTTCIEFIKKEAKEEKENTQKENTELREELGRLWRLVSHKVSISLFISILTLFVMVLGGISSYTVFLVNKQNDVNMKTFEIVTKINSEWTQIKKDMEHKLKRLIQIKKQP